MLVLLAALVGPYFVDWGNYRDRFEAEASRILGQEVRVAGGASARLLPFPSVTFNDVRVGPVGANTITVEEFSMGAELAPFLRGEILIFDMNFVSPVVRLDLDEDGTPIWEFPSQTPVDPAQIILENASFSDGTVVLRDKVHGRQWDFVALNGIAAADSLFGPWRVEGSGLIRGAPFSARISTGNLDRKGFSTRIAATLPDNDIELTTEGRVAPPTGDISSWYSGTFKLRPTDEGAAYLFEGLFEADARSLNVQQFRGDFGDIDDPYSINGSASILGGEAPSFSLQAKGNQLSIGADDNDENIAVPLATRIEGVQELLARMPFPPIAGTIDLDLPAIVAGNTTIRNVRILAAPESAQSASKWNISSLEAQLPGRTVLEGSGRLSFDETNSKTPRFEGQLLLASRQPSGLANWLSEDVSNTIRLLPNAGFSAKADISADRQAFTNMEVILGEARLFGDISRNSAPDRLPNIELDLKGDKPDLDTLDALSNVLLGGDGTFRVAEHDVDMTLAFTNAEIWQTQIGRLTTDLRIRGERTEIDRLSLENVYGGSVSTTGKIVRETTENGVQQTASWDAAIFAPNGAQFIEGLGATRANNALVQTLLDAAAHMPSSFSNIELNSVGSAIIPARGDSEASASISGTIGGSQISMTSTLNGRQDSPSAIVGTLAGTIENDEASTLLTQAGFEIFPLRLLGEGKAQVSLSGSLDDGLSASLELETPDTKARTNGVFRTAAQGLRYMGTSSVTSGDVEPWFDLFGYIFPSTGLGTTLEAQTRIRLANGVYSLTDLDGAIGGNDFAGDVDVSLVGEAPKINGALRFADVDLQFLASILSGKYDLSDGSAVFAQPLYADHAVDLNLAATRFGTDDAQLQNAKFRLIYRDGALSIDGLEAELGDGLLLGSVELQNNEGSIFANGQIGIENGDLYTLLPASAETMSAETDVNLSFSGSGKTIDAFIGSITGSGVANVTPFELPGINVGAISTILQRADVIGYQITDDQIIDVARDETRAGSFRVPELTHPFAITSGVARMNNIVMTDRGAVLDGDLSYDLASQSLSGKARITYDAGSENVAGTLPEIEVRFEENADDGQIRTDYDYALLAGFVRQRALEREQARVEALQARLLEKQRLRREVRYMRFEADEREREAEAERLRLAEIARQEAERLAAEQRLAEEKAAAAAAEWERKAAAEEAYRQRLQEAEQQRLLEQQNTKPLVQPRVLEQNAPAAEIQAPAGIFENLNLQIGNGN